MGGQYQDEITEGDEGNGHIGKILQGNGDDNSADEIARGDGDDGRVGELTQGNTGGDTIEASHGLQALMPDGRAVFIQAPDKPDRFDRRVALIGAAFSVLAVINSFIALERTSKNARLSTQPMVQLWHSLATEEGEPLYGVERWWLNNVGLGPARFEKVRLIVNPDSKKIDNPAHHILKGAVWEELKNDPRVAGVRSYWDAIPDQGEGISSDSEGQLLFEVRFEGTTHPSDKEIEELVVLAVCACSLHGDCWYEDSRDPSDEGEPYFECG